MERLSAELETPSRASAAIAAPLPAAAPTPGQPLVTPLMAYLQEKHALRRRGSAPRSTKADAKAEKVCICSGPAHLPQHSLAA